MYQHQSFLNQAPVLHDGKIELLGAETLYAEPSLFACSPSGVRLYGGVQTRKALIHIEEYFSHIIEKASNVGLSPTVDVRVQRLMPGMYPSIPGWHCDFVPRNPHNGQPDFSLLNPEAFNVCLILSSEPQGVSNTEYVTTTIKPKIWDGDHVYRDLHRQVERIKPETIHVKDGWYAWFNGRTIHKTSPTLRRGVRLFLRYSMVHKPSILNKVGVQQQVYLLSEENGW